MHDTHGDPIGFSSPACLEVDMDSSQQTPGIDTHTPKISYPDLLRQVLHSLNLSHFLVEGPPLTSSLWMVPSEGPQGASGMALASDDCILAEILQSFKVP